MMRHTMLRDPLPSLLLACALLAACREASPPATAPDERAVSAGAAAPTTCTHRWASGVSGDWHDATKWNTGTVPGSGALVCISAAGTYTVTVNAGSLLPGLHSLSVGDGSSAITVEFTPVPSGITLSATHLTIAANARLITPTTAIHVDSTLVVRGRLDPGWPLDVHELHVDDAGSVHVVADPPGVPTVKSWNLTGEEPRVTIRGIVDIGADVTVTLDAWSATGATSTIAMEGGAIQGEGALEIREGSSSGPSTVLDWSGGTIESPAGDPTRALVSLRAGVLVLRDTTLVGGVELNAAPSVRVEGDVGAGVHLRLHTFRSDVLGGGRIDLRTATGAPPVSHGRITLTAGTAGALRVTGAVVNRGTMVLDSTDVRLELDSLVNHGTVLVLDSTRFTKPGGRLRNAGAIIGAGSLVMADGSEYIATSTGTINGPLGLENGGRLLGRGNVGGVTSVGGVVGPGGTGIGTLTISRLTLDAASRVIVDIGGTAAGQFDQLDLGGAATFAGAIEARSVAPFVPGLCGQTASIVIAPRGTVHGGAFTQFVGFQPSPTQAWRVVPSGSTLQLAGFDPSVRVGHAPGKALLLTEGGASAAVEVCLGRPAPTASVTLTPTPSRGQVTASPSSLLFAPGDWGLPRRLTVSAVDDASGEGAHADVVHLAARSSDPAYGVARIDSIPVALTDDDPGTDLALALLSAPSAAVVGQQVEARFRLTNQGPGASSGSTFTIAPLAGLAYLSNGPAVACAPSAGLVTCTVGALAAGAQLDFTVRFTAQTAGAHANTARIAGLEYDHVASNDALVWNLTIN
jgi:hypothetical protein